MLKPSVLEWSILHAVRCDVRRRLTFMTFAPEAVSKRAAGVLLFYTFDEALAKRHLSKRISVEDFFFFQLLYR